MLHNRSANLPSLVVDARLQLPAAHAGRRSCGRSLPSTTTVAAGHGIPQPWSPTPSPQPWRRTERQSARRATPLKKASPLVAPNITVVAHDGVGGGGSTRNSWLGCTTATRPRGQALAGRLASPLEVQRDAVAGSAPGRTGHTVPSEVGCGWCRLAGLRRDALSPRQRAWQPTERLTLRATSRDAHLLAVVDGGNLQRLDELDVQRLALSSR